MDLESAAQCEMAIHDYTRHVASPQLRRGRAANVRLKRDVVYKIPGKLEAIAENQHAATKDAQLDDFIAEAISRGDSQFSEIGLGDLHFSGEAVVRGAEPRLSSLACPLASTGITGWRRASSRFELSAASGACWAMASQVLAGQWRLTRGPRGHRLILL